MNKAVLQDLYYAQGKSLAEVSAVLGCSINAVAYWMEKHRMTRRSIGDAVYLKRNPDGDPFCFRPPKSAKDAILYGIGVGLYWGEGTKANKASVRLGNTDPILVSTFMKFLIRFFGIRREDFRFSLQLFEDIDTTVAARFWQKALNVESRQFTKPTISPSQSTGTYRRKSQHGVVTLYYHNKKLRDLLLSKVPA